MFEDGQVYPGTRFSGPKGDHAVLEVLPADENRVGSAQSEEEQNVDRQPWLCPELMMSPVFLDLIDRPWVEAVRLYGNLADADYRIDFHVLGLDRPLEEVAERLQEIICGVRRGGALVHRLLDVRLRDSPVLAIGILRGWRMMI
ncbi:MULTISPECIES: hypothetical protein [Sinorhizobium]|uniref:hypothetical protein n=1 Tax=Sinorhizobium TaxID=28105 RepID=UPI001AECFA69|nr:MULTISPECIES: hypothetical protein [Sinorhizobium]